jgi:hypothetical protein
MSLGQALNTADTVPFVE